MSHRGINLSFNQHVPKFLQGQSLLANPSNQKFDIFLNPFQKSSDKDETEKEMVYVKPVIVNLDEYTSEKSNLTALQKEQLEGIVSKGGNVEERKPIDFDNASEEEIREYFAKKKNVPETIKEVKQNGVNKQKNEEEEEVEAEAEAEAEAETSDSKPKKKSGIRFTHRSVNFSRFLETEIKRLKETANTNDTDNKTNDSTAVDLQCQKDSSFSDPNRFYPPSKATKLKFKKQKKLAHDDDTNAFDTLFGQEESLPNTEKEPVAEHK
ncbi:hypothetical protein RFI_16195 [Reticulomyxa filosa]|uniref:Uncharacterized protein n=1 Tax=Reticulomyxa filosa TaxID=46433 RepID=X6N5J2_RETFI|nr:hypothetical protein RFI_16195 [Reticulomyxa filosa]|eukprot:ETO21009.1 hypothetical protein RFI_16195 [Reticulomyxa filosa]